MLTFKCGGEQETGDDLCDRLVSRWPARWCLLSLRDVQSLRSMPPEGGERKLFCERERCSRRLRSCTKESGRK